MGRWSCGDIRGQLFRPEVAGSASAGPPGRTWRGRPPLCEAASWNLVHPPGRDAATDCGQDGHADRDAFLTVTDPNWMGPSVTALATKNTAKQRGPPVRDGPEGQTPAAQRIIRAPAPEMPPNNGRQTPK